MTTEKIITAPIEEGPKFQLTTTQRTLAYLSIVVIYFFYCYNFMVGIFVKPTMIFSPAVGGFGFTLKETEQIFAAMSFGTIPGTFLFGMISTRFGKRNTLIAIATLISLTTFLPMLDPTNVWLWQGARFCTGVVLGGVFGTAMPLVADLFPQKFRGKLAASLTALFSLAMIFGGQLYGAIGNPGWKILMYSAIIPPLIGAVLTYIFVPNDYEMSQKARQESEKSGEKINYLNLYKGKYLWIGIGTILLSGANFTAYSSFFNNATTYLVTGLGLSAAVAGSIYSMQGFGQLAGYIFWGGVSDRFGRKVPLIGMLMTAAAIFAYTQLGAKDITAFYTVSILIGFSVGFSGVWGAYYTELFPEKYRGLSAGLSFNGGRIISTFALPMIAGLSTGGMSMVTLFYVAISVFISGAIVWFFLPETLKK